MSIKRSYCKQMTLALIILLIIYSDDIETNPGPKKNTKVSFCRWNLNGIAAHNFSKASLLKAMTITHKYDIICLPETFFDSSFNSLDGRINIKGYNFLRAHHPNDNKRGGVSMYFKEHLPILKRDDLCTLPEDLVTEIRMGKKKCFFRCLYRSPSQSPDECDTFCSNLNLFLSSVNDLNPASSIVIGDYNARTSK